MLNNIQYKRGIDFNFLKLVLNKKESQNIFRGYSSVTDLMKLSDGVLGISKIRG